MKLYLAIVILLWITISTSFAQRVKGIIYDAQTTEPIAGAVIISEDSKKQSISNQEGRFEVDLSKNNQNIQISFIGYQFKIIEIKNNQELLISLEPKSGSLNEIMVTASRESTLRSQTPVAISKLSSKQIDEAKPIAVYEILNKVPGVLMVNLNNEQHSMSIRQPMTTANYYLYLEDGLSIRPMGIFNHNALLEINQFAISSIEVVKGPTSSVYGPEAIGGTVNFITQRPTVIPTARLGVQFDQWGYKRLQFGAGSRIGKFGFYIGGLTSSQNNSWMASSDYNKSSINTRLEYHFSTSTRLISTFVFSDYDSQMSGSVDSIAFYKRKYLSSSDFTYRNSKAYRSRLTLEQDWNSNSKSFITAFYRNNKHGQNPSYGIRWSPTSNPTTARGEINSNNFESYGLLTQHSEKFKLLNAKLIAGAQYDFTPNNYYSYQVDLNAQLREDGKSVERYTIAQERPDIELANYDAKLHNAATFLQYDIKPTNKLVISTGLRYDLLYFNYDNYLDLSSGSKRYQQITPKLGATYDLGNEKGLYLNYSRGFAPPGLTAIFRKRPNTNPAEFYYNLEPAKFHNYEVGGWAAFLAQKINFDFALYLLKGKNELLNIRQADNSFDYQSAGETLHRGIELGFTVKPIKQIVFRWSGTTALHRFEDFKISDRSTDKITNLAGLEMPSAPRYIWNTELSYYPKFIENLRFATEWQYVSGWYQNQINTVRYKGYNLINFRTGYQLKGIEIFVNIFNITDELYASNVTRGNNLTDRATFTAAAPRTFVMGLQYNFSKSSH